MVRSCGSASLASTLHANANASAPGRSSAHRFVPTHDDGRRRLRVNFRASGEPAVSRQSAPSLTA
jgi:hypothetical protein